MRTGCSAGLDEYVASLIGRIEMASQLAMTARGSLNLKDTPSIG